MEPHENKPSLCSRSKRLPVHQWLVVVSIMGAFLALALYTHLSSSEAPASLVPSRLVKAPSTELTISIQGAVQFPGSYTLEKGATLGDLLSLAVPTEYADLRRCKKERLLRQGREVTIPSRLPITIYLTGAVAVPGPIALPQGTRLCDLSTCDKIAFLQEADLALLDKKRYLKEGEVVHIAFSCR